MTNENTTILAKNLLAEIPALQRQSHFSKDKNTWIKTVCDYLLQLPTTDEARLTTAFDEFLTMLRRDINLRTKTDETYTRRELTKNGKNLPDIIIQQQYEYRDQHPILMQAGAINAKDINDIKDQFLATMIKLKPEPAPEEEKEKASIFSDDRERSKNIWDFGYIDDELKLIDNEDTPTTTSTTSVTTATVSSVNHPPMVPLTNMLSTIMLAPPRQQKPTTKKRKFAPDSDDNIVETNNPSSSNADSKDTEKAEHKNKRHKHQ